MVTQSVWLNFPLTYRAEEMARLARWIAAGESGSVVGLPGCGRSNLLGFLCYRPEALQAYLPPQAGPVVLAPVDLNDLPAYDLATLYRVMLRSFYRVCDRFEPALQEPVIRLYLENRATLDAFLSQSALQEVLLAFQSAQTRVVLVLNRFDRFCQEATPPMLNTLRSLRDSFKETLCFIVGMRQEVAYLPNPEALGDVYELLDSHICWVGPMQEADARWVIASLTQPVATLPTEAELGAMLTLTGGLPVLLKAISFWWLDQADQLPLAAWPATLMAEHYFDYRLSRLWQGLTQEEQFALAAVGEWQQRLAKAQAELVSSRSLHTLLDEARQTLNQEYNPTLARLAAKGICRSTAMGWEIVGTLLADYIKRVGPSGRGRIRLNEQTEEIYQGLTPLRHLPPLEDKLLRFLIKHPYERHTLTHLINEVWGSEEWGRTANDLQRLVSELRKKIEVRSAEPHYLINWRGRPEGGYQFYPEGRPDSQIVG